MTTLSSAYYSGQCKTTKEEDDQRVPPGFRYSCPAIVRVDHVVTKLWTKPTDMGHESACMLHLSSPSIITTQTLHYLY